MCMIDFGCYTNHSVGMSTAAEYNAAHYDKGRVFTFICDRYSVNVFPEMDELSRRTDNRLRCGLEIDVAYENRLFPVKCIAISDRGIDNLYKIAKSANGKPLCINRMKYARAGILIGFSGGYDIPAIRDFTDFWYLTPCFSNSECAEIYAAAQRSGKPVCVATNACYVNKDDEKYYKVLHEQGSTESVEGLRKWNHMMSEREMFEWLSFLGSGAAWEILIHNPYKMLDPYWEYISNRSFPWKRLKK